MTEPTSHLGRTPLIGRQRGPDGRYTKDPRHPTNRAVDVDGEAHRGSGRPAAARAGSPSPRRTPRDVVRARNMLAKAVQDLQAGTISGRRGEAIVRAANILLKHAERRVATREAERKAKVRHVIELQSFAGGETEFIEVPAKPA